MSLALHYWMRDAHHCTGPSVSEMTYTVSSGMLNSTIPYHTIFKKNWQHVYTQLSFNWPISVAVKSFICSFYISPPMPVPHHSNIVYPWGFNHFLAEHCIMPNLVVSINWDHTLTKLIIYTMSTNVSQMFFSITLEVVNKFQWNLAHRARNKCTTMWHKNYPLQITCVCTLPCKVMRVKIVIKIM